MRDGTWARRGARSVLCSSYILFWRQVEVFRGDCAPMLTAVVGGSAGSRDHPQTRAPSSLCPLSGCHRDCGQLPGDVPRRGADGHACVHGGMEGRESDGHPHCVEFIGGGGDSLLYISLVWVCRWASMGSFDQTMCPFSRGSKSPMERVSRQQVTTLAHAYVLFSGSFLLFHIPYLRLATGVGCETRTRNIRSST